MCIHICVPKEARHFSFNNKLASSCETFFFFFSVFYIMEEENQYLYFFFCDILLLLRKKKTKNHLNTHLAYLHLSNKIERKKIVYQHDISQHFYTFENISYIHIKWHRPLVIITTYRFSKFYAYTTYIQHNLISINYLKT